MKEYIGEKVVIAEPVSIIQCGKPVDGYRIIYRDGLESWSSKDVFEEAYKPLEEMC